MPLRVLRLNGLVECGEKGKGYVSILTFVIGTCLIDIDGDKHHFVSGTDKFRIYFIFHQNNDDNDVVNDYEGIMNYR